MLHVARSKNVANFIFSTLTTSEFKLEHWRFNHRNLSVNILNKLPRNMSIMGQNRSADFKAYWKILFTSGRLLDNRAPRRVKQTWQGGISISPDLCRLVPPHVIPSIKTQSDVKWENMYCTSVMLWDTGIYTSYIWVKASLPGNMCDWQLFWCLWRT